MIVVVRALRAEWTKLRTVRSSGWLLLGVSALTIALGALIVGGTRLDGCTPEAGDCDVDTTRVALSGVYVGQSAAAVLGVLVLSSEYATGTMRTTLAAVPRRSATFLAKAAVVVGPVLLTAVLGVAASLLVARLSFQPTGSRPHVATRR